jgi:glyoxylase-like metal-dependent hydrolase (beta-lactamase superfamily II)
LTAITLGDFEIHCISAGRYRWDGGAFFGVVPKTMWSRKTEADSLNRIPLSLNCYLIRTGDHHVLIETGVGDKLDARARERMDLPPEQDPLPEILARQGFDPESIDIVINTHLHFDHCGGNTVVTGNGPVAAFPRARYFAARGEWEHAHQRHPRDSVSYNDQNYDPLVESGRMILVEEGREVVPGIRMRPVPGHNRDMCIVTAVSGGRTFCFWSDLVPTAAHTQPTWVAAFDLFPLEVIDNKLLWLATAAREDWVCGFGHEPVHAFARIRPEPKTRFAAVPEPESPA